MKIKLSLVVKSVLVIMLLAGLISLISTRVIYNNYKKIAYKEEEKLTNNLAKQSVAEIKTDIGKQLGFMNMLSDILEADSFYVNSEDYLNAIFSKTIDKAEDFVFMSYSYELSFLDTNWEKDYGRVAYNFLKTDEGLQFTKDSLDLFGHDEKNLYFKSKQNKTSIIEPPYWHSFTGKSSDNVFKSNLIIPLMQSDKFLGVITVAYNLEKYKRLLDSLSANNIFEIILLSDKGTIISHPEPELIGLNVKNVFPIIEEKFNLTGKIKNNKDSIFILPSEKGVDSVYYALETLKIGETNSLWGVVVSLPLSHLQNENKGIIQILFRTGLISLILLIIILTIFFSRIVFLIRKVTNVIEKMAEGNVHSIKRIDKKRNDEIGKMVKSTNIIIDNLNKLTLFAENIGRGNFDYKFEQLGEEDSLGIAILEMRNSLVKSSKEEGRREELEKQLNWASQGTNLFNRILRVDNPNLEDLCFKTLESMIVYLDAQMGGIYLKQEDSENYELTSFIGFPKKKYENKIIKPGEGLVGQCILEKDTVFLNEIPKDFTEISSGLGKTKPKNILLVPLIENLKMIGVLEIESLKPIYPYQIEFVEKTAVTIASTILIVKTNINTNILLEQSRKQAQELENQEEEMRQNMEEMEATQEEAKKQELLLQNLIDGFYRVLPIIEYNEEGICLDVNDNYLRIIGIQKSKLIGKKHKADVFMDEQEQQAYNTFWKNLQRGETVEQVEFYKFDEKIFWIREYFIPLKNEVGSVERILCIGIDISNEKRIETDLNKIRDGLINHKKSNEKKTGINLDANLKILDLTYLKMVYKKDPYKIENILNLYSETLSPQILELEEINKERDFKKLKMNINSLKTKISYMGLKEIYEDFRKIEKIITENKNLTEIENLLKGIKINWAKASKELQELLNKKS